MIRVISISNLLDSCTIENPPDIWIPKKGLGTSSMHPSSYTWVNKSHYTIKYLIVQMFEFLLTSPYCAIWLHKFMSPLYLKTQKMCLFIWLYKQTIWVLFLLLLVFSCTVPLGSYQFCTILYKLFIHSSSSFFSSTFSPSLYAFFPISCYNRETNPTTSLHCLVIFRS